MRNHNSQRKRLSSNGHLMQKVPSVFTVFKDCQQSFRNSDRLLQSCVKTAFGDVFTQNFLIENAASEVGRPTYDAAEVLLKSAPTDLHSLPFLSQNSIWHQTTRCWTRRDETPLAWHNSKVFGWISFDSGNAGFAADLYRPP